MSSAGHVLDMIQRINNNRNLQVERHSQYTKVKKVYQKHEMKHTFLTDKNKLSAPEIEKLRLKIKCDIQREFKKRIVLTTALTPFALLFAGLIIWRLVTNWSL